MSSKGVYKSKDKWRAIITINYKMKHIGTYDTEEEARRAYLVRKEEALVIRQLQKDKSDDGPLDPITEIPIARNSIKRQQTIDLHLSGMHNSQIARELKISKQRVHQLLTGYTTQKNRTKPSRELLSLGCGLCFNEATDIHHKDRNSWHNDTKNLLPVCKPCHGKLHGKNWGAKRQKGQKQD